MKCSAYIATSADGFIATKDGSVDWLHSAGNGKALAEEHADMGFNAYLASVDCMIMGRKTLETISDMNLNDELWPYGDLRIIVLSSTLSSPPANMKDKIELFSGDLTQLIASLEEQSHQHAYIDGGTTIQAFMQLNLLNEITITKAPVLLGEGIPLFGKINTPVKLDHAESATFENDFVQLKYRLNY
jgi:dihydrofolate reductase